MEDPIAIHRASGQRSQNTPFLLQYGGRLPVFMGIFPSKEAHKYRKAKRTELCKGGNPSQLRKYKVYLSPEPLSMFLIGLNVYNHSVLVGGPH